MQQKQPPSIFANNSVANTPRASYPETPAPNTPLDTPPSLQQTAHTPWKPALRLDSSDPIPPRFPVRSGGSGGIGAPQTPPALAGKKRPLPLGNSSTSARPQEPTSEPLHKRRRVQTRARYSLDHFAITKSAQLFRTGGQPPSPLFFSSRRDERRPHLPARFSSSEAAARMLSKTREEGGIKTVTLARGTFNGLSPPGPTSIASGRSSERSSMPRTASPDARERTDPLRLLGSVGIVELLEQDTRPTFIVDIADAANYASSSSTLQILFANSALRSSASTWGLVAGRPSEHELDEATALASNQFRNWLLSTVINTETPDLNPSPVEHGGVIWSCYTLRKRLRVVSGAVPTHAASSITPASGPNDFPIPSTSSIGVLSGNSILASSYSQQNENEGQDYFGSTAPAVADRESTSPAIAAQRDQKNGADSPPKDVSGIFQKPTDISIPSTEDSASFTNESVLLAHSAGNVDAFHREQPTTQDHDVGFFDWTRLPLTASLPRHIQFARSVDWSSTPLGPIEYWSNDLRAMCNLIM
jgi:hypothetical protein